MKAETKLRLQTIMVNFYIKKKNFASQNIIQQ